MTKPKKKDPAVALQRAAAYGKWEAGVTVSPIPGGGCYLQVDWSESDEPRASLDAKLSDELVTFTNVIVHDEDKRGKNGEELVRHIITAFPEPLAAFDGGGLAWRTTKRGLPEPVLKMYLRAGFVDAGDGWLVADRSDPESPMNKWAAKQDEG